MPTLRRTGVKGAFAPCGTPQLSPAPVLCIVFKSNHYAFAIGKYPAAAGPHHHLIKFCVVFKLFDTNFFGGRFRVLTAAHCLHDCVKNRPHRERTHSWLRGGGEKWKPAEEEKVYLEVTALFLPLSQHGPTS